MSGFRKINTIDNARPDHDLPDRRVEDAVEEPKRIDNLYERFLRVATRARQDPAIIVQKKEAVETWTFGDLLDQSVNVSAWLGLAGIQAGDRCAILSENQPRWCVAYLGILQSGAVVVPLDIHQGLRPLELFLRDSNAKVLFVSQKQLDKARQAGQGFSLKIVLLDGDANGTDVLPFPTAPASREVPQQYKPVSDDPALLLYTSGTTTDPKGVALTHGNLLAVLDALVEAIPISPSDRGLAILPLFHILAQLTTLLVPLSVGGLVVMVNEPSATEVLRALQERRITVFCCVPQFFYLIHQRLMMNVSARNMFSRFLFRWLLSLNSVLRRTLGINLGKQFFRQIHVMLGSDMRFLITGGSRFDPTIARDFYNLGFEILQGYGLTECGGNATLTRVGGRNFESVGYPVGKTQIKIVPLSSTNEEGEIAIRGPNVMAGYHNRADLTSEAIKDGWLLTGDLGRLDSSGCLYVTGRKKEVIVLSSGKNIYPEELEDHYRRSSYVKELCIVPRSEQSGLTVSERLHAVVVPDMELMRQERVADVYQKIRYEIDNRSAVLPTYQRVRSFQLYLEDLPRTTTRKLKRHEVAQLATHQPKKAPKPWSEEELEWLKHIEVSRAVALIRELTPDKEVHPADRLDLDLDQDSLSRVEMIVQLQEAFGTVVPDNVAPNIRTVRELVDAVLEAAKSRGEPVESIPAKQPWRQLLASDPTNEPFSDLHERPAVISFLLFIAARCFFLAAKLLLRLKVHGKERLGQAPLLLCPNHQTFFDGVLVACALPWRLFRSLFFVGWDEFFPTPLLRWVARTAHIILLNTDSNLTEAMQVCAAGLRNGKVFLIFPEGERTIDGALGKFHKGVAILSSHTGVPMVPIAIKGAFQIWPRGKGFQRLHPVTLKFGAPIPAPIIPEKLTPAESVDFYEKQTRLLAKEVSSLIKE